MSSDGPTATLGTLDKETLATYSSKWLLKTFCLGGEITVHFDYLVKLHLSKFSYLMCLCHSDSYIDLSHKSSFYSLT